MSYNDDDEFYNYIYCDDGHKLRYDEMTKIKIEHYLFGYIVFVCDIYNNEKQIDFNNDNKYNLSDTRYSITKIINNMRKMINLKELIIKDTIFMQEYEGNDFIGYNEIFNEIPLNLYKLEVLEINNCNKIKEIPDTLINLKHLEFYNCNNIKEIPKTLINLEDKYTKHINKSRRDDIDIDEED